MKNEARIMLPIVGWLVAALFAHASEIPTIQKLNDGGRLIVNRKPYLILGGELGNSSAGTAAQADSILLKNYRVILYTIERERHAQ